MSQTPAPGRGGATPSNARFLFLAALLCLCPSFGRAAGQTARILLWPGGAPDAKGNAEFDQPFLDAWAAPRAVSNRSAFVVCPGGGYAGLALDHEGSQVARWFNGLGASAFILHYRLGSRGYHYPVQLIDVQRAIRLVRANATAFGVDPNRIGVMGFSAGGHLASMAATLFDENPEGATHDTVDRASARPDVAVLAYPVISMVDAWAHIGSRDFLLGPRAGDEALARSVSTDLRVTARTPPTFLFQTDEDATVPAENAVQFYLACRRHAVPAELHVYRAGPHGVGLYLNDPTVGTWGAHLGDWLRNQGFFSTRERAAVHGMVAVDGIPVSWGSIVFLPEDPDAPVASARVMHGEFALDAGMGPVVGTVRLRVSYSAADASGLETADGTVTTRYARPGDKGPWEVAIKPGSNTLELRIER